MAAKPKPSLQTKKIKAVEIRHLRYFIAVAEELHFNRAAARLHIAQPPLSRLIRRLEEEVGSTLFERTKRQVALTQAGKVFLNEAQAILARLSLGMDRVRSAAQGGHDSLKLGFAPWADFTPVFADTIRTFSQSLPNVALDFHSILTPAAVQGLLSGQLDVAFISPSSIDAGLSHQMFLSEPLMVALPEHHNLSKQKVVRLQELANEPHIVVSRGRIGSYYDLIDQACQKAGFTIQARHEIDHPQTTLTLIAAGVGISLVPASYRNAARSGVIYRRISPTIKLSMIIAWRTENQSEVLQAFLNIASKAARCIKKRRSV